jgi:hypothetical protein
LERFGHEEMAGDTLHRGQHAFVADVVMAPQPLNHLGPGARVMRVVLSVVKIRHRIQ